MKWHTDNILSLHELQERIRSKDHHVYCACLDCDQLSRTGKPRLATDRHHLDGNHSNNEPSNLAPACKLCHNAEHNITAQMSELRLVVRNHYAIQKQRKAQANRVGAYQRLGLPTHYPEQQLQATQALEAESQRYVKAIVDEEPFYQAWLQHVKGVAHLLGGQILAELGSPDRFSGYVSRAISYAGLYVDPDGAAPRKQKGKPAPWNQTLHMALCGKLMTSFLKNKHNDCFGYRLYENYKAYYVTRDGPEPAWRADKRARRRVAKDFLRCLFLAWLDFRGLQPAGPAHPNTEVKPEHWLS